ncbi:MAG: DUF3011 domain-containing protein [Luteimonas sp.]
MALLPHRAALAALVGGLALSTSVFAAPQYGQVEQIIRCESIDGRARSCPTPWRGYSRIARQLSGTACIEGRNWQSRAGEVSVNGGCRAEFVAQRLIGPPVAAGNIRCESNDGRPRSCATPWRGRSRLVRQLSSTHCIEGRNWQSQSGQVSVSGGCRAEFGPGGSGSGPPTGSGGTVRCESSDNRPRSCPTPWRGRSRLVRQISGSSCIEGRTWQSRNGEIHVNGGCRGEFAPGRGGDAPPIGGDSVRCESNDGRLRSCATPWRGGSRLLRQISGTACIEGRNWDSQRGQVSVSGGCRGEFGPR